MDGELIFIWLFIIVVFGGGAILVSAEDTHTTVTDERGCLVVEHIDNPVFFGDKTRTVQTYCPEDK